MRPDSQLYICYVMPFALYSMKLTRQDMYNGYIENLGVVPSSPSSCDLLARTSCYTRSELNLAEDESTIPLEPFLTHATIAYTIEVLGE